MDKEEIYDREIAPLMAEIIKVCQREKIAMLSSFSIPTEDNPQMKCTTALVSSEYGDEKQLNSALNVIMEDPRIFQLRVAMNSNLKL